MKRLMLITCLFLSFTSFGSEAKKLFKKYGCEGCHADYGIVAGPSFYMIKEKYLKKFNGDTEALKKYLYQTIRKGSSGKWFDFLDMKMPSHPQIKEDEMKIIIDYIASIPEPKKGK